MQQLNFSDLSNTKDSQKIAILDYLKQGNSITPLEALERFKCMRLGARIWQLIHEDGFKIEKEMVKVPSGKTVASYRLNQEKNLGGVAG